MTTIIDSGFRRNRNKTYLRWFVGFAVILYLIALSISYFQRAELRRIPRALPSDVRVATVPAVAGDKQIPGSVDVAYRDVPDLRNADAIPVVLIHGSPGSSEVLKSLMAELGTGRRLIAPDLPGFGYSTRDVPDYSFQAHAVYVWELLDKLGIRRVHLVGFSMGGGVVLNMARTAPERVASVTMLSALNVQEFELLGDYHINHAIHGAQLAGLWLLKTGLPRFGAWNRSDMGVAYARNFYDSDQRPLRGILQNYNGPMLVLHGQRDPLVPIESAREVNRLVPQSELVELPSNHFMVFENPRPLIPLLSGFLDRVESGRELTRSRANAERLAKAGQPMEVTEWPKPGFVTLTVTSVSLALGTLVSEDLTSITAGILVAEGRINLGIAILACFAGIFGGDVLLFLSGRWIGRKALGWPPFSWWFRADALDSASAWLTRNGAAAIFLSRFVPGARLPTYFAAGALRTSAKAFLLYFLIAAAIWTPLIVGFSAGVGLPFMHSRLFGKQPLSVKLLVAGTVLFVLIRLGLILATYRGRRSLVRRWRRLTRWEFWPAYVFYAPVFAYILYLGARFRGLTLFTAANPAIPAGGFVGESKQEILERLGDMGGGVPYSMLLREGPSEARVRRAKLFLEEHELKFPVVLKPDAGQRGSGVAIIRSVAELEDYIAHANFSVIVQEYIPGVEFGIFYVRHPSENCGYILSITEKRMPVVVGDGRRSLEELILADERAVAMSSYYIGRNCKDAHRKLAAGEQFQLVEIGTHCRGAIFLDGGRHLTKALGEAIDRIAGRFAGFYFGRFDVRVPSSEDLEAGRSLKVVELNGVTSEATHIYDAKLSLAEAYGVLFKQWRLAFEIGNENRVRGAVPTSARKLFETLRLYHRMSQGYPR
jgi:pimeloyl-ACP methyl ester carboxylesterase/membrane protein DedA with SNARE-associated domain